MACHLQDHTQLQIEIYTARMAALNEGYKRVSNLGQGLCELVRKGPANLSSPKGIKNLCLKKLAIDNLIALGPSNDQQLLQLCLDHSIPSNLLVLSIWALPLAFPEPKDLKWFNMPVLGTWASGISLLQHIVASINQEDLKAVSARQAELLLQQLDCTTGKAPGKANTPSPLLARICCSAQAEHAV